MKQRVIAAFAAFGLVAVMSGLGTIPAMAEEPVEPPTTVVEESAPAVEETAPPAPETAPPVDDTAPAVEETTPPAEGTEPPAEETEPPVEDNTIEEAAGPEPPAASSARVQNEVQTLGAGTEYPAGPDQNHAWYWEAWIKLNAPHANAVCYKHDNDKWNNDHGYMPDAKTVKLKTYGNDWPGDHYELLVVKAATVNVVYLHPTAGTAYIAYQNKDVSHYIVCKGDTPPPADLVASASVTTTPGTCEAAGTVVTGDIVNATFGPITYKNGKYTVVATADDGAKFPQGPGVSQDRKTKTFTGDVPKQDLSKCPKISYCHAHPADTAKNGWELMANQSVESVTGHKQHKADIIPPNAITPSGVNWNATFTVNGVEVTAQEILRAGCDFEIKVPKKPSSSNEYCDDGEAQDGSITVYFGDLGDKIQYRITGNGIDPIVIENGDPTTVYLPAGNYQVKAEGVPPYEIDGSYKWDVTIKAADCTQVDICHWDKYKNEWKPLTVTESQAYEHAKDDKNDIIPAFGSFTGKNLDTVYGQFWTGQQVLLNDCDKPYFEVDLCHWDKWDQKWEALTVGSNKLAEHTQHDKDIIPAVGPYPGKNLTTDFGGVTGQQLLDHDCTKKVWVPEPEWSGEQCYDGETVDGWIGVYYSADLVGKVQYRVTGTGGFDEVVLPTGGAGWYSVDVPAGDYTVTAEPIGGWVVKGYSPYELTISSATNCQCFVPVEVNERLTLLADIAPACAEAEVSVTPPSCEAAAELVLGSTLFATFGEPVIAGGEYTVTATADPGFRFAPGEGVSEDGFTKEFTGDLPGKLTACGQLTTLALTGGSGGNLLWVAALATMLGIGAVVAVNRRTAK